MKKGEVLVVGGTGFIGYHLSKKLLRKGFKITSISSRKPNKKRYLPKVKYIICDISNKRLLKKKIKKTFKYVINLGGYVDHSHKKKTFESHYHGCKNLTEIFQKNFPKAFIQMGSSVEYGNLKSPQKEDKKYSPRHIKSIYGKAKLMATNHLINLHKKKNFPSVILRLYLAYGPKQDFNRFIPIIIKGCIENKKFPCSEGQQLRDFVYVDDVVDAIIKSLTSEKARGQIINIGSGKPIKIKKIIEKIKRISNSGHPQYGEIKLRKDEILELYPNIQKAKKLIRWVPKVSFKRGLNKTISSYEA